MLSAFKKIKINVTSLLQKPQISKKKYNPQVEQPPDSPTSSSSLFIKASAFDDSCFLIRLPIIATLTLDFSSPSIPARSSFAIVAHRGKESEHVVVLRAILEHKTFKVVSIWPVQDTVIEKVHFNGLPVLRLNAPTISGIRDTQYWIFESEFDLATFVSRAPLKLPINVLATPRKNAPGKEKKRTSWRFSLHSHRRLRLS